MDVDYIAGLWEELKPRWDRAVLASSAMKGHDADNPFVRSYYEHGYIIADYGSAHTVEMDKYAKNRGFGEFHGYAPVKESDRKWCEGYFWGVASLESCPRRIKYEHRMILRDALPRKSKKAVTWAKRLNQGQFLEWILDEGLGGVRQTGCESWAQFWRQVRNGPAKDWQKPEEQIFLFAK